MRVKRPNKMIESREVLACPGFNGFLAKERWAEGHYQPGCAQTFVQGKHQIELALSLSRLKPRERKTRISRSLLCARKILDGEGNPTACCIVAETALPEPREQPVKGERLGRQQLCGLSADPPEQLVQIGGVAQIKAYQRCIAEGTDGPPILRD